MVKPIEKREQVANGLWDRIIVNCDGATLDPALLRGLINGDYPVVLLKGLLSEELVNASKERLLTLRNSAAVTQYANGSLTLIGTFLVKYLSRLDEYYVEAAKADARTAAVGFDLPAQVRDRLRRLFGFRRFEVATEIDGRRYASSNVRICANDIDTPLHNDDIRRDGAQFPIILAGLKHQLSCVVCLQESDDGGELSIFRKPWQQADEVYKVPSGLGYDMGVVAGKAGHEFRPQAGDVYLLNPTNYHAVKRVTGKDRITLGFFFGFFDDELDQPVGWV